MAIKQNILDRVIGFFAPQVTFHRMRARAATNFLVRGYDGAAKGRRTKGWKTSSGAADTEISGPLNILRDRSRDLVRNNPFAAKAKQSLTANVVGTGIILSVSDSDILSQWKDWAESKECDYHGQMDFYALQSQAFGGMFESGEILFKRIKTGDKKYPVKIQALEADFLDKTKTKTDNSIRDGIEFNADGTIKGYHLYTQHPGSRVVFGKNVLESTFVPAEDIIHLFRIDRPGQIRGVPWLAPVMMRLRDYDDYEDAQLVRQKIAACFVGFMIDNQDPINQTSSTAEQKPMSERFEPGAWEVLPPGKDIKFATPPGVGTDYEPYTRRLLLSIASGIGITYEMLTSDYGNVNFSSGRMGWIEVHRNIEQWRYTTFIPQFCERVWQWWVEGMSVANGLQIPESIVKTWTPPRREMIDPTKEVGAMKDAIRSGLATLSDSVRQLGFNPDEHFAEYAKDMAMLDKLKLKLDSDPRVDMQMQVQNEQQTN